MAIIRLFRATGKTSLWIIIIDDQTINYLTTLFILLDRVGVELWGSKSIGEATEAQTESIKSKRKVGEYI